MTTDAPYRLVLLRHGESEWNAKNLFTGWVDVGLSERGRDEAIRSGALMVDAGVLPDLLHTSVLRRAIQTAQLCLDPIDRHWLPVRRSWRLNERHYGALQGKNKKQTLEQYGEEQFMLWRRSYDTPPPRIADDDEFSQTADARYAGLPDEIRPRTECLADVVDRMLPYWYDALVPAHAGDCPRRGSRQLAAGARQAPRRHVGLRRRQPQHPDRHTAALRARP
jgi:2,3-bisphosphoglycerate-dependent phosphoglycerate mutase